MLVLRAPSHILSLLASALKGELTPLGYTAAGCTTGSSRPLLLVVLVEHPSSTGRWFQSSTRSVQADTLPNLCALVHLLDVLFMLLLERSE